MAFHETRLPTDIERRAVGGPGFRTSIIALSSGHERRNIMWSATRGRWDIGYAIKTGSNLDDVIKFFYAREGRAHGFRFKDWSDFEVGSSASPQQIGLGDDSTVAFQIYKRYTSGSTDYDRNITKPVSGEVSVYLDGVLQGSGYSVDTTTGIITFDVAPASTGGTGPGGEEVVAVYCEYDVPVRFDVDQLDIQAELYSSTDSEFMGFVPSIPVVEIRV